MVIGIMISLCYVNPGLNGPFDLVCIDVLTEREGQREGVRVGGREIKRGGWCKERERERVRVMGRFLAGYGDQ